MPWRELKNVGEGTVEEGRRRAMVATGKRTYVDVILRIGADGTETPQFIMLPDGRTYEVSRVTMRTRLVDGEVLSIQIGSHATSLWKEARGWGRPRWYVRLRG